MFKFLSTTFLVCYSLFSIAVWKMKRFYQITWQRKPGVKFWSFCKFAYIHKIPLKTVERSKLVGKTDFLLTFFPVIIVQTIYIYINIYVYLSIYLSIYLYYIYIFIIYYIFATLAFKFSRSSGNNILFLFLHEIIYWNIDN